MERNYDNFYSKISSAKLAYVNEPQYQDWLMKQREKRKELVAKGVVSFEPVMPMDSIGFYVKVKGIAVTVLNRLFTERETNHLKCDAIFKTVIAMESKWYD